jgi:hypothetical protein
MVQRKYEVELMAKFSGKVKFDVTGEIYPLSMSKRLFVLSKERFEYELKDNIIKMDSKNVLFYLEELRSNFTKRKEGGVDIDRIEQEYLSNNMDFKAYQEASKYRDTILQEVISFINDVEEKYKGRNDIEMKITPEEKMAGSHVYLILQELGILELLEKRLLSGNKYKSKSDRGFDKDIATLAGEFIRDKSILKQIHSCYRKGGADTSKGIRKVKGVLNKYGIEEMIRIDK